MRYCLPIQATSIKAVDDIISAWNTEYDAIELWLDLIADLTLDWVQAKLSSVGASKLIFLFRRPNLEKPLMAPTFREALFSLLVENATTLDLDINSQQEELELLSLIVNKTSSRQFKFLASYHNYTITPQNPELQEIYLKMIQLGADAIKFSTCCQSEGDAIRLLEWLLTLKTFGKPCTVLGMGALGQATRIFGSLWGNDLLFAPPLKELASAPGQLTIGEYKDIFSLLGSR